MSTSSEEPYGVSSAATDDVPPEQRVSAADAAGRLDDDPTAQPELSEDELTGDRFQPVGLDESDLAPVDDPDDS